MLGTDDRGDLVGVVNAIVLGVGVLGDCDGGALVGVLFATAGGPEVWDTDGSTTGAIAADTGARAADGDDDEADDSAGDAGDAGIR